MTDLSKFTTKGIAWLEKKMLCFLGGQFNAQTIGMKQTIFDGDYPFYVTKTVLTSLNEIKLELSKREHVPNKIEAKNNRRVAAIKKK